MNFTEFLNKRKLRRNISSTKEHYESLGGEKKLQFSLRHFRELENGNQKPSVSFLENIFNESKSDEFKDLIVSYFNSNLENASSSPITKYITDHLQHPVQKEEAGVWESKTIHMIYSSEQLDYLTKNEDALVFHKRVLLYDKCNESEVLLSDTKLKHLIDLDLIEFKPPDYVPSRNLYKVPRFENSPPKVVTKATEYITKQVEIFMSKEGNKNQEISYAFQLVDENKIPLILEQMKTFKNWIQSLASENTKPPSQPIIFFSFFKMLDKKELGFNDEQSK